MIRSSLSPTSMSSASLSMSMSNNSHLDPNSTNTAGNQSVVNPFTQKQAIKSKKVKRQQGSSRFIMQLSKELEPLPPIRGNTYFFLFFV